MIALIDTRSESQKLYSRSLSENLNLVHFDIEPKSEPNYSFNLYPALDVLCQAFSDLIKKFQWKHAAIIYNSDTNLESINCLLTGPGRSTPKLDIAMRMVNNRYEYRSILRDVSSRNIKNIIIDLNPEETEEMLKIALQLGMINATFNYIITNLDIEIMNLDDYKYNRANITAFRLVKSESDFFRKISLNLSDYFYPNWKDNEKNKILLKVILDVYFKFLFKLMI